ncbi:MAG: hypothetical protein H0U02_13265, partial [Rubrobacter sp.]|nr:hypothetical protein [Rubrobacter sp.]
MLMSIGRRIGLLLAMMAMMLLAATSVALASIFFCNSSPCIGTDAGDFMSGEVDNMKYYAKGGPDQVFAKGGTNSLYGDAGNDQLFGSDGNDT